MPPRCTSPLVSAPEAPPIDPKCPIHGAGADAGAAADAGIRPMPAAAPAKNSAIAVFTVESDADREGPLQFLSHEPAGPNHWKDEPPDEMAFRCPHCGAWRPAYGFSAQRAELPGIGTAELMAIFCGLCKVILQIQLLDISPGAGGRGFPTN